nr:hypothetical protein BDOA9_0151820 [Bradyrhizobium sp. DOA9]
MASPVCRCANSCCHLSHSGPWVPGRHPVFPAPFSIGAEVIMQSSGEISREEAKACLRAGCELKNAVAHPTLRHCEEPLRRSNPDCLRGSSLDCFAAFAMTVLRQLCAAKSALVPRTRCNAPRVAAQSRGPCISESAACWVSALRSSVRSLQRVRDTSLPLPLPRLLQRPGLL